MKLTALQRTFIATKLGVKPRVKSLLHIRSGDEKTDDAIQAALTDYLRREQKVLDALAELEKAEGTAEVVAAFELEVERIQLRVKAAVRDHAVATIRQAHQDLDDIKARARKAEATGKGNPQFYARRKALQAALKAMDGHLQKSHVLPLLTSARDGLAQAEADNAAKRYPESIAALTQAQADVDKARRLADKFQRYRQLRVQVVGVLEQLDPQPYVDNAKATVQQADQDATLAAERHDEAIAALTGIRDEVGPFLETQATDGLQQHVADLEALPQAGFIAQDIQQLKDWLALVPAKVAAGEWAALGALSIRGFQRMVLGRDRATRRQAYLDQRGLATNAITPLRAQAALTKPVAALDLKITANADPLATAAQMRFEEGMDVCRQVVADCGALGPTAALAKTFTDAQPALAQRLEALKKHAAAPRMADALALLAGLAAEASRHAAAEPPDWAAALEAQKRLAAELDVAEQSAPGLAAADPAQVPALAQAALQQGLDAALAAATQRRDLLANQAKAGSFTALVPLVDRIQPLLDQAQAAAKMQDHQAASAAISQANAAALAAEQAATAITAYDQRATPLAQACATLKQDGAEVGPIEAALADAARALAERRFADARKLQDRADAQMEVLEVQRQAQADPDGPALLASADKLLKLDGGDKLLDDFVQTLGDGGEFDLIAKLAEKRFGILLSSDDGGKTISAKALWDAMASVPASHATHSPSLKAVKREDPDGGGGAFGWLDKEVEMNGRPDDGKEEQFDAATRAKGLGLPLDHDMDADPYAPVDDQPANLFNLTMLHEIGHAVDDRLAFMNGKAGDAAFGGWHEYADLGPIADAVARVKGYDREYVMQRLGGLKPDPVAMPEGHPGGEVKWAKAKVAVDTWYEQAKNGQLWWDYAQSKDAAIDGVVYQEAYPSRWVSYLLAERPKGVTAYQWRAPGEWFAELYMCWYGKKLKDSHPFASWLKTL